MFLLQLHMSHCDGIPRTARTSNDFKKVFLPLLILFSLSMPRRLFRPRVAAAQQQISRLALERPQREGFRYMYLARAPLRSRCGCDVAKVEKIMTRVY